MKRLLPVTKKGTAALLIAVVLMFSSSGCQTGDSDVTDTGESANISESMNTTEPVSNAQSSTAAFAIDDEPEPDNDWEFDAPENHGMDSELLEQLHSAVDGTEIYSVVTAKDGYIIDEYYKEGYDENSVFTLQSCSKTFTGALIGIAIDQGLISGVDAKLSEFLPQLAGSDDAYKQEITIGHLLTHTSGIEWYEWGGNSSSWRPFQESENWVDYILSQRIVTEPGTAFNYTTGGSHLLAAALQETAGKTAYEFGLEHLFQPMGMDSVGWRDDPQGVTDGGNGIAMSARDAAKFGQLYLDGGRWRGRQMIPEAWVEESVQTQYSRVGNSGSYGYQWWLRPFGAGNYDTYYAMGFGGQFVFVVPELDLVTVITSRFRQDTYAPWPYFTDYVLAACNKQQD